MKKNLYRSVVFLATFLILLQNSANSVLADTITDSYTDTSKINTGTSSYYQVTSGQLKMAPPGGNAGFWKMDEASGTSVADSSGNSNTGTVYGTGSAATGGTVTTSGGYVIHTFTTVGNSTFTVNTAMNVESLVVGGGGGGGSGETWTSPVGDGGGGGGGGGIVYTASHSVTPQGYTVTVGTGGPGGTVGGNGTAGNNSTFAGYTGTGGGMGSSGNSNANGGNGGSGGGAGNNYGFVGYGGTGSQGYNGGDAAVNPNSWRAGSGGGGKNSAGTTRTSNVGGGGGGGGNYSVSGLSLPYSGGGGAGDSSSAGGGAGGSGVGGAGGTATSGSAGMNGRGGGGGGGGSSTGTTNGGNGGSGIVIVRYPTPSTIVAGQYGNARSFNGTSDYISVPNNATLNPTTAFTAEAWVKLDSLPGVSTNYDIAVKEAYCTQGYRLYSAGYGNGGKFSFLVCGLSGPPSATAAVAPTVATWYHVAGVYDGSSIKLYINGGTPVSTPVSGAITNTAGILAIGAHSGVTEYMDGTIDDVRIYNYARTQAQIQVDMNNSPYEPSSTIISNNLLAGVSGSVSPINSFVYNLSAKPAGTEATIQFSQNGTNWYNSAGTPGGTNTLTTGANNSIDIHGLGWTGANFYYKIVFTGNGTDTPVLNDIAVNYTGYANCANIPTGGNYPLAAACAFPGTVNGVDTIGANDTNTAILTMNTGASLTVLNGQTLAVGSLQLSGGTITIIDGGQIKIGTPLYLPDVDGDGYPTAITTTQYTSPATGRVRRSSAAADCNDSNISIFRTVAGYIDGDGDGYGTGAYTTCAGATGTYVANNTDCNDSNISIFRTVAGYIDGDGDGYGTGAYTTCTGATGSYVANGTDCNDTGTSSVNVATAATCYVDVDNDNYGSTTAVSCISAGATCASATWASGGAGSAAASGNFAANNTDCSDTHYGLSNLCCWTYAGGCANCGPTVTTNSTRASWYCGGTYSCNSTYPSCKSITGTCTYGGGGTCETTGSYNFFASGCSVNPTCATSGSWACYESNYSCTWSW